jgi:hypothetical protein
MRTAQDQLDGMPAVAVGDLDWRAVGVGFPAVAPLHQRHDRGQQIQALVGEAVLVALALASLAVGDTRQHSGGDEGAQPLGEQVAGAANAGLEFLETPCAVEGKFYRVADTMLQMRKSKWLGLVQQNGVYSRLEPADILLLRTDFEVIVVSGHAFFWKKSTIERAFGFLDKLKAESLADFNAVTTHLRRRGVRHQRCLRFESMDGRALSGRLAPAFLDMQSCNPQRIQS